MIARMLALLAALPEICTYEINLVKKAMVMLKLQDQYLDLQEIETDISKGSQTQDNRRKYLHYATLAGKEAEKYATRSAQVMRWVNRVLAKGVDEGRYDQTIPDILTAEDAPAGGEGEQPAADKPEGQAPKKAAKKTAKKKAAGAKKGKGEKPNDDIPF